MKTKKMVLIGELVRKKSETYYSQKDRMDKERFFITVDDGADFTDFNVTKELYDSFAERRIYAFNLSFDNQGKFPDTEPRIVGLAMPNSLEPLLDTYVIISNSELEKYAGNSKKNSVKN